MRLTIDTLLFQNLRAISQVAGVFHLPTVFLSLFWCQFQLWLSHSVTRIFIVILPDALDDALAVAQVVRAIFFAFVSHRFRQMLLSLRHSS